MRKFSFNLERLLSIREHEEKDWEMRLGREIQNCSMLERKIAHRRAEIRRMLYARSYAGYNEGQMLSSELYSRRMEKEISTLGAELSEAEKKREEVRLAYLEASKNRKVLERLKEKRQAEYYKNQLKTEFNEVDDQNNSRAAGRYGLTGG